MKKTLIAMLGMAVIVSTGLAVGGHGAHGDGGGGWHRGNPLDHITETLNLTPDQQAKVQPIVDQAKPQLIAIHKEAMEKSKAVVDNAMGQIRPMLTPDQQKKADDLKKAHEDMRNAMKRLHEAKGQ
jgi:protein CpxP